MQSPCHSEDGVRVCTRQSLQVEGRVWAVQLELMVGQVIPATVLGSCELPGVTVPVPPDFYG
jgi:hypothetical protein